MLADHLPILIGVSQYTNHSDDLHDAREPMDMMALVAQRAAEDAGAPQALRQLDSVTVINILSWPYADPSGTLAARLGAQPREARYITIGGNTPQWAVNDLAERIGRGEVQLALIAGAEAMYALRLARQHEVKLPWPKETGGAPMVGDTKWGNQPCEQAHRAQMPTQVYPLFENALRALRLESPALQRQRLGRLCAGFARVARDNPYAWFRDGKSAEEIITPSAVNRMIGFPYPKYVNAIMDVDQAAALLLTSVGTAKRLGIPEHRWVYVWGSGDATDHWFVSDRVNFYSSPAIEAAGAAAMEQAGVTIDDVGLFDLYSCFPCAPQIAAAMLGVKPDDPRLLTVTGGLPYAGGPGNNYCAHSIATMADRLRAAPGAVGLISGVGWYMTKHAIGLYSAAPPLDPHPRVDPATYQRRIDAARHPECIVEASGDAKIETYTVLHDRDGAPETGLVVGRLSDGRRFWANTPPDRALLEQMEREEFIGRSGRVHHVAASGTNVFEF